MVQSSEGELKGVLSRATAQLSQSEAWISSENGREGRLPDGSGALH